jgi:hypothetical protein
MFSSITWEVFFSTVLLAVGVYYFISTVLLFHKEITGLFKAKSDGPIHREHHGQEEVNETEAIIGAVSHEENWLTHRTSLVDSEDVRMAETDTHEMPDTIQAPGEQELLNGTIADLMQEIKTLLQLIGEYKSSKEECAELFGALFQKYPLLKDTSYQRAINQHICEENKAQFSFDIQPLDVRSWWEG